MIIKSAIHRIPLQKDQPFVPLLLADNIGRLIHRGTTTALAPLIDTLVTQGHLTPDPPRINKHKWRAAVVVQKKTNSIFVIYQWRVPNKKPNTMKVPTPNSPAKKPSPVKAHASKAKASASKLAAKPAKKPAPAKTKSAAPKGKKRTVRNTSLTDLD